MTEKNTNTAIVTPELKNNTATLPSPGAVLRLNRENSSLSQEDVSIALNVTVTKVKNLEADEFEKMHSESFTRGYLRSYAKLLKIDGESLIACYDQYIGVSAAAISDDEKDSSAETGSGSGIGKILSITLLLLAAAWFVWEGLEGSAVEVSTTVAVSKADDPLELPDEVVAIETVVLENVENVTDADSAAVAEAGAIEVQVETATPNVQTLDKLKFVFTDECWVEVTDSSDDVLFADIKQSGEILELEGVAPFNVMLGNAGAAELSLNGEPVPIALESGQKRMVLIVQASN